MPIDKSTDGCTFAPDLNIEHCCAEHDFYYRNEVGVTRFMADIYLFQCMWQSRQYILAPFYFLVVRFFGWYSWHQKRTGLDTSKNKITWLIERRWGGKATPD